MKHKTYVVEIAYNDICYSDKKSVQTTLFCLVIKGVELVKCANTLALEEMRLNNILRQL